ncbi:MAG: Na(+)-translocating NADH-quinone reductase subunit A [Bacteroidales bacterium]
MSDIIKIKKGLDIRLKGAAEQVINDTEKPGFYAVKPTDFHGLVPRSEVQEGDAVQAGTVLFIDKNNPEIRFCSPVSGKVKAINRGDRRALLEIVVEADNSVSYKDFVKEDPDQLSRDEIVKKLLESGIWTFIRQRPFNRLANPMSKPKSIFISGFDSSPLAADVDFILQGTEKEFLTGIKALSKLTDGKIHIGLREKTGSFIRDIPGIEIHFFNGPHPSGNVGIQINKIDPIGKGDIIWTVKPQEVVFIGRLFDKGIYDVSKVVALAGSQVNRPQYYRVIGGTAVESILSGKIKEGNSRIISGNVLTGTKIEMQGFLGHYDNLITVIPEGDSPEFLGWAAPGLDKFSASRTFLSSFFPRKIYDLNTNTHGCERAYVVSGQYEKVLPMDIYPVYLVKAILAEDIELMEKLGIYEVAEEDFALCEYVCTSKIQVQSIISKGIDLIIKELG